MSNTVVPLRSGGALMAIVPQSVEDVYRLATMAYKSGMLKPLKSGYGDAAETEAPESTLARGTMIIMQGMEIGLPPMQSLQLLAMINGRICAHSEAVPGILLSKGFRIAETWSGEPMTDEWACSISLTRPDGSIFTSRFSVADAKQAGLWDQRPTVTKYGKTKENDSPWLRYPKRMLKARALGFAGKDGGADALRGMMVHEEAEDHQRVIEMSQAEIGPPRRSAHAVRKSGEYEKFEAEIRACESADDIDKAFSRWSTLMRTWPDSFVANAHGFCEAIKMQRDATPATDEPDDPIADVAGYLLKLAEDRDLCTSVEDLEELKAANAEMIARLPLADQLKAAVIFEIED